MENHIKHSIQISTNALTDDRLEVLEDGYCYKGKGTPCKVCIVYYTYANEWGDRENRKYFTTPDNAVKWYKKEFRDRAIEQGRQSILEFCKDENESPDDWETDDTASLEEWENLVFTCLQD